MRRASLVAAVAAVVLSLASPAAANGRFPASNQLVFSPSNPNRAVLRATFGILVSSDYGATWTWLCEDALGLPPTSSEDPSIALTRNDTLVAGLSRGLFVSPDLGCNWTNEGGALAGQVVKDVAVLATAADTVLAITSTFGSTAGPDGGQGYVQHVFTSSDDGANWTETGTIDPEATVTTVDVAPTDPERIYVSAYRGAGNARTTSIFVSSDAGKTWTEHATPLDPNTETDIFIAAVDPNDENRLYVRSEGASRLLVSIDGGQTFQVVFSLGDQMLGFALSQDGSRVYLGGPNVGLFAASSADLQFTRVLQHDPDGGTRMIHVQCLATHGADLWACSDEASGFVAGVSQDEGVTFTPKAHLLTIGGPASCPAGSTSSTCIETNTTNPIPYNPFGSLCANFSACGDDAAPPPAMAVACNQFGACSSQGGSGGDATPGDDAGPHGTGAGSGSSGGCSVVGQGGVAGALLGAGLAAVAARRRRR